MVKVNVTLLVMSNLTAFLLMVYIVARIYDNTIITCDNPVLQQDFNITNTEFMGRWYEMMREKDIWFQSGECGHVFYEKTAA